jgi:serine protease Do
MKLQTHISLGLLAVALVGIPGLRSWGAETPEPSSNVPLDVRRDPTVAAVEKVLPSVVNVATRTYVENAPRDSYEEFLRRYFGYRRQPQAQYSRGSGVVISEDGYVLTNVHVVGEATDIWVNFFDDEEAIPAERVAGSQSKDVALLKLKPKTPRKFKPIKFAKDDDLLLGETVLALGQPFGLTSSISRGILSSKARRGNAKVPDGTRLDIGDWLQTDASINPGNSGGPLVNLRGELIGLNVAVLNPDMGAQGIGFAIPIRRVNQALAEVLSGDSVGSAEGRYWFGARLHPGLRPLTVQNVDPGSPADGAGLKAGDVILELNAKPPGTMIDFNRVLVSAGDQKDVSLTVRRSGETRRLLLRLVPERAYFNNELLRKRMGLTLRPANQGGAFVVASVERGGPAAEAGLAPGMFVTQFDGQPADDIVSVAKLVNGRAKSEVIDLDVVVIERNGGFLQRSQGVASVKLR